MFTPETNLSIVPHYMYKRGEATIYFIARSIDAHTSLFTHARLWCRHVGLKMALAHSGVI